MLSGGEPFLYPGLDKAVWAAADAGLQVGITTNGTIFSRTNLRSIRGRVSNLQVSLDSIRPDAHDALRGVKGSYHRASTFIKEASEIGFSVTVAMVVLNWNIAEVPDAVETAYSMGATGFRAMRVIPVGRGRDLVGQMITPEEVSQLKDLLRRLQEVWKGRLNVSWDSEFGNSGKGYCTAGDKVLTVLSDGTVVPCSFLAEDCFVVGSLHSESIMDVWRYSPRLASFRASPGRLDPRCPQCPYYQSCHGGCRAVRESGIWPPAAYCPVGQEG